MHGLISLELLAVESPAWLSARTIGIALWTGLAILTVALVVLSRTRLGQVKPVAKCIILSVFAHVLLLGYAYGTKLILAVPTRPELEPFEVELVDETPSEPLVREPLEIATDDQDATNLQQSATDASMAQASLQEPWDSARTASSLSPEAIEHVASSESVLERPLVGADNRLVEPDRNTIVVPRLQSAQRSDFQPNMGEPTERPAQERVASNPRLPTYQPEHTPAQAAAIERPSQDLFASQNRPENDAGSPSPFDVFPGISGVLDQTAELPAAGPGELRFDRKLERETSRMVESMSRSDQQASSRLMTPMSSFPDLLDEAGRPARAERSADQSTIARSANSDVPADFAGSATFGEQELARLLNSSRVRLGDGELMPAPYRLRRVDLRGQIAAVRGGNEETEFAVDQGLDWLARHQEANGRWDSSRHGGGHGGSVSGHERTGAGTEADTGVTGLALLAFLGAGHTHLEGDYREEVRDGIDFLIRRQDEDGSLHGSASLYARMYCHGMALLALSEAFAMTGDHRLREAVEAGVRYTIAAQHPASGGWRYQPRDLGDLSQFGWQVMALKSSRHGGIVIPAETEQLMKRFLNSCMSGEAGGLGSYRPGERTTATMSAEGLVCRLMIQDAVRPATVREGQLASLAGLASLQDGPKNYYYLYYGTLAMFLAQEEGWSSWNDALQTQLLPHQSQLGDDRGSWPPDSIWGVYGGKVYSTALATLCLEVYYRYLPIYDPAELANLVDETTSKR